MSQRSPPKPHGQAGVLVDASAEATGDLAKLRHERDTLAETVRIGRAREATVRDEVQHRVRNMLAVIRSLLRRTLEASPSPDDFTNHFEGRLDAVARYQVGLISGQQRTIELEDIIRDELLPTNCLDTPACRIAGPAYEIEGDAIEPFTLAIHELATNAFKFGALKGSGGKLDIGWSLDDDDKCGASLRFRWTETGVSIVAANPHPHGFGRQFIEEALPYQLAASTSFDLRPGGIECTIVLPVPSRANGAAMDQHYQRDGR